MKLENLVAIVTGSARGIGFEVAKAYAKEGAKVVICDLNKEDCIKACNKIKEERHRFYQELTKIKELSIYNSEANYFMIKLNKGSSNELAEYLLTNNKILIKVLNDKNGFDDYEYIRIAIKTEEENNILIDGIKNYYKK